jgi:hypothetical protein
MNLLSIDLYQKNKRWKRELAFPQPAKHKRSYNGATNMPKYDHTQKPSKKSIEVAKAIIQSDKYSEKEKKCVKALKYAALVAAMLASSACTSSFGVVSWDREVHRMYYDRHALNDADRQELDDLIGRVK